MRQLILYSLLIIIYCNLQHLKSEESAQYLQNVMRDLRNMNYQNRQTNKLNLNVIPPEKLQLSITTPPASSVEPLAERRVHYNNNKNNKILPSLSLTKGELAALYENAVSKGETIKLDTGNNSYIHAAVHEIDNSDNYGKNDDYYNNNGDFSGYYYYYYPIKSFIDEMTSQPTSLDETSASSNYEKNTYKPHYQYHSHTHQHNVNITSIKEMMDDKKGKKALEPLFMAISGFVGMAVMFILSVLVLPKFGLKKSVKDFRKNERVGDIARIALRAIEGDDCTERFACELEKTARTFNLQDNRFIKLLKRMTPISFGKKIIKAGKNATKRLRCTAIPCKKKATPQKNKSKKT